MRQLLLAFQFLTIVPVRVNGAVSEKEMAQSAAFFPLVGAFQGLIALSSAILSLKIFTPEITAGLITLVLILTNGGFHLDGLADTFDAISVKSTGNREIDIEKRLSVMKDSTTGAIGVVAITSVILLKFLLISNIFRDSSNPSLDYLKENTKVITAYSWLFMMPVFSKWVMVIAMHRGTPARQEGLGKIFLNNVKTNTLLFSSVLISVLYLLAVEIPPLRLSTMEKVTLFVMVSGILYIFAIIGVRFCNKKFSGVTGDNLGAMSEISEVLFLMVVTVWLRHFI